MDDTNTPQIAVDIRRRAGMTPRRGCGTGPGVLDDLALRQGGVATRAQLLAAG